MDFFRFLLKIIHHTAAAKRGVAITCIPTKYQRIDLILFANDYINNSFLLRATSSYKQAKQIKVFIV